MAEAEITPVDLMIADYEQRLKDLRALRERIHGDDEGVQKFETAYRTKWVSSKPEHWENCRCFASRWHMLQTLPHDGIVVEVGTQRGEWARQILDSVKPQKLTAIDINYDLFEYDRFTTEIADGRLELIKGESAAELAKLPDGSCDWIYIDAGHSYFNVKSDAVAAVPKLKPEGYLVFNDFTNFSFVEFLHYGVLRTAIETALAENMEFTHFALGATGYHDVALRRKR